MRTCLTKLQNANPITVQLIRTASSIIPPANPPAISPVGPTAKSASTAADPKKVPELKKYPVPQLHSTLEKFLKSIKPFFTVEEACKLEADIKKFGEPGGEGEKLQELLLQRASKMDNWLEDWWVNQAYLEYRDPVVFYSSPGLVFPKQKFESYDERIVYAAKIIAGALEYKDKIDKKKIPQEKFGAFPLDMGQYEKIFGTCRIPGAPKDSLEYHPKSEHIIVAANNIFFKVKVKYDGCWVKYDQIVNLLKDIYEQACQHKHPKIGILTTENRDNWAAAYSELKSITDNCDPLKAIEESLFLMCIDKETPKVCKNDRTTTGMELVHAGGPKGNAANRWFDKTIQFVICQDGGSGLTYEHSPAEGQPIAVMMDFLQNYLKDPPKHGSTKTKLSVETLCFTSSSAIDGRIKKAEENLQKLVDDTEFNCFSFKGFGKEELKKLKLSPDSFIQMAFQYAFYRIHQVPGAQYESGATRMFKGGRTETIRSCSEESIQFAKAMLNPKLKDQSKANALRLAVQAHKEYTLMALNALGVDRHLGVGFRRIAKENKLPVPSILTSKGFEKSTHMRVSTSQVASIHDGFMVFGPLVKDGYATCYNPRKDTINFGTSCFKSDKETSTVKWEEAICLSLNEMRDLLIKAPQAKL